MALPLQIVSNLGTVIPQTLGIGNGRVRHPNTKRGGLRHTSFRAGVVFAAMTLRTFASQSVELSWTPSASPNIVGYAIYYGGASGNYTNEISAGNTTTVTVAGLLNGATYYFAVRSINSAGIQSAYSIQASYRVPSLVPMLARPIFSSKGMSITIRGVPGYLYVIQASTNLVNWISLETNLPPLQISDTNTARYKRRFYRAVPLY